MWFTSNYFSVVIIYPVTSSGYGIILFLRSCMIKLLDDVHKCYYCCLARMGSFQTAVAKPSKVGMFT